MLASLPVALMAIRDCRPAAVKLGHLRGRRVLQRHSCERGVQTAAGGSAAPHSFSRQEAAVRRDRDPLVVDVIRMGDLLLQLLLVLLRHGGGLLRLLRLCLNVLHRLMQVGIGVIALGGALLRCLYLRLCLLSSLLRLLRRILRLLQLLVAALQLLLQLVNLVLLLLELLPHLPHLLFDADRLFGFLVTGCGLGCTRLREDSQTRLWRNRHAGCKNQDFYLVRSVFHSASHSCCCIEDPRRCNARRPNSGSAVVHWGCEYMSLAGLFIHTASSLTALREYPENRR